MLFKRVFRLVWLVHKHYQRLRFMLILERKERGVEGCMLDEKKQTKQTKRKPCHTWLHASAQAWHSWPRVTSCRLTVGPQTSQVKGQFEVTTLPDLIRPNLTWLQGPLNHAAVSALQTWGADDPIHTHTQTHSHSSSRLGDTPLIDKIVKGCKNQSKSWQTKQTKRNQM